MSPLRSAEGAYVYRNFRRLAGAVIADAAKSAAMVPIYEKRIEGYRQKHDRALARGDGFTARSHEITLRSLETRLERCRVDAFWFLSPDSNLSLWAGVLGHDPNFYRAEVRSFLGCHRKASAVLKRARGSHRRVKGRSAVCLPA